MTCKNLTTFSFPLFFPINILIIFNISSTFILNHIKQCYNFCFKHQTSLRKFKIRRKMYCYYPYFYFFYCSWPLPNVLRLLILPFSFCLGNFLQPFSHDGLLVTNSLSFFFSDNVLVIPSLLKNIFPGYRTLD